MADTLAATLTLESPLASRLWAWSQERFPPKNLVFIGMLFAAALLFGRRLELEAARASGGSSSHAPRPLLRYADAAGFLAAVGFFLMLRVYDEHKDYELDVKNHPGRVLQRGLVTLGHLKVLWVVAVLVQAAASLLADGGAGVATLCWAVTMAYGALMAKEFFAHAWLSRRLVLYALSHMIIMPVAVVWLAHLGAAGAQLPPDVLLLGALSFVSGFAFEIARKTKAPEDERETVDSYTKIMGVRGTAAVVGVLTLGQAALLYLLMRRLGAHSPGWQVGLGLTLLPTLLALARFVSGPAPRTAKKVEDMSGLALVAGYALLVAALVVTRGRS